MTRRVLFVTWDGPQVNYLESLFVPIFQGLQKKGIGTDILQFRWGTPDKLAAVQDVCAAAGCGYRAVSVARRWGSAGSFLTAFLGAGHLRRALRDFKSDIIMPRSVFPAIPLLRLAPQNIPVIWDSDGLALDERVEFGGWAEDGLTYRFLRDVEARVARRSSIILTRTRASAEILSARAGPSTPLSRFHLVSNGRDANLFQVSDAEARKAIRSELGISADAPLLIYAGSVGGRYRTDALAMLALKLRSLRSDARILVLTGAPDEALNHLASVDHNLLQIADVRTVPHSDVPKYLAAADIGTALITSSFSTLGIDPVKTGEYLLCGLPVVGTAAVGQNAAALAEGVFFDGSSELDAAAKWIADVVLPNREEFRRRCRQIGLAHYSLAQSVAQYLAGFEKLATSSDASCPDGYGGGDGSGQASRAWKAH
jgi:glycosyltransferase involved in cell wall biosynthesis